MARYTYDRCVIEFAKRRSKKNNFRNLKNNIVLTKVGDVFSLSKQDTQVNIYPDDRMQIFMPHADQSARMFVEKITGIYLQSRKNPLIKENIRVWHKGMLRKDALPFINGMWARDGKIMNPEKHIDFKRVINKEKSLELQRKYLRELSKLGRVMAKMDLVTYEQYSYYDNQPGPIITKLVEEGVSAEVIQLIAGPALSRVNGSYWYNRADDTGRTKYRIQSMKTALTKFSSALYEHCDVYAWVQK